MIVDTNFLPAQCIMRKWQPSLINTACPPFLCAAAEAYALATSICTSRERADNIVGSHG